jgi:hypothetical protein
MTQKTAAICLVSIFCLFLFGCATGPTYSSMQSQIPPVVSGKGRVFFYQRFATGLEKLYARDILVDNQRVGSAKEGVFFVDLPPGAHMVSLPGGADPAQQAGREFVKVGQIVNINLGAGESRYIEFDPSVGARNHPQMVVVDPAQGSQEILDLPYIGH